MNAIAGNEIPAEHSQTNAINNMTLHEDIFVGYAIGSDIAQYLSNEIIQRFKIDAVLASTSNECHISHHSVPNSHT
jgi:hypothetical protein